ncbi:hypothetical protein NMG60_11001706 [Bertholletia excelsa]
MTHATAPSSTTTTAISAAASSSKRRKLSSHHQHHQPLLPGLPDHIAQTCLSVLPPSLLFYVSRSWRRLLYCPSFPPFLSLYAVFFPTQNQTGTSIGLFSFDPISSAWHALPPPPDPPRRPIVRHPAFLARNLPLQSLSVAGKLVILAATADHFLPAFPHPLVFDPITRKWTFGPRLPNPRRWCATGSSNGIVYVASGIGSNYNQAVARSVEKWAVQSNSRWKWEKMGELRDGRLSRDAIDAVPWRGKLCMVNVKGDAAKNGVVYDIDRDSWEEMPEGMVAGWRGPAAAMDEETIYVVNETTGTLRRYDAVLDSWELVVGEERLRGAEQMAASKGKVCVVASAGILVVDVAASPAKVWQVDTPAGFQAITVHVLPRMSQPDL